MCERRGTAIRRVSQLSFRKEAGVSVGETGFLGSGSAGQPRPELPLRFAGKGKNSPGQEVRVFGGRPVHMGVSEFLCVRRDCLPPVLGKRISS